MIRGQDDPPVGSGFPILTPSKPMNGPDAQRLMRQLFETRDVLRLYAEVCGRWEQELKSPERRWDARG